MSMVIVLSEQIWTTLFNCPLTHNFAKWQGYASANCTNVSHGPKPDQVMLPIS
jgi:hypothetical protein